MLRPVCYLVLKIAARQEVEIGYCPQYQGIWLNRGEIESLGIAQL